MKVESSHKTIAGWTSIFMDCLRIVAALMVFIGHAYAQWYSKLGYNYGAIDWGHVAVVVFFALSGYVIAYTTTVNNRGPINYAQARLSRLYSVVLPAVIITFLIELIISSDAELAAHFTRGHSWPRYVVSALFINEVWFFSASPLLNGPLWSLCFEFWYYFIFGLYLFKSKKVGGWLLPLLACVIAGPKILVMMPIWIMGNIAYRAKCPIKNRRISWMLIAVFIMLIYILVIFLPGLPSHLGKAPLFFASQFITDNIIGIVVATILWLLPTYQVQQNKKSKLVEVVRKLADLTFPLYVLHDPFLVLFRWFSKTRYYDGMQMCLGILFALMMSLFFGYIMERNRYRWIGLFKNIFSKGRLYYSQVSSDRRQL